MMKKLHSILNFYHSDLLHKKFLLYAKILRLDKPIGIYLLLWPSLVALSDATAGQLPPQITAIFVTGVVVMRSLGCLINDWADRKFDKYVSRTQHRPLTQGLISIKEVASLGIILSLTALSLALCLNKQALVWSLGAFGLSLIYPFCKRFFVLPQAILGCAFAWSIPMAFAALDQAMDLKVLWLYLATVCWVFAYDTQYALVDRQDDLKLDLHSSAIFFGRLATTAICTLQAIFLGLLIYLGILTNKNWGYYWLLLGISGLFYYQWLLVKKGDSGSFKAFLNNHWVGALWFIATLAP